MPAKLSTTLSKIETIPNQVNAAIVHEYSRYLHSNGLSDAHQNNTIKAVMAYAKFIGPNTSFFDIQQKEQIQAFLDERIKSSDIDPEKRWITTWNDYLRRLKMFYRWLYNGRNSSQELPQSEWKTPDFLKIKEKRSKRLSPYSETQIWERDELLSILKYEPRPRNKAAITLFWDMDARNHEVTLLRIKNIRLKEQYGEGEVPAEAKTGSGPIMLTCSFPYVRDWLNQHPNKNDPEAPLICNQYNGKKVRPDAMWLMMSQLRGRIIRLLGANVITDPEERQKLEFLLRTKKWNPYCIRHSAITADADYLPEYAVKKKVRWSMISKQPSRYIKNKMGNDLKRQILAHNGIMPDDNLKKKPAVLSCPKCALVNGADTMYCSKCAYPLTTEAFDLLKQKEIQSIAEIEMKYDQKLEEAKKEMHHKLEQVLLRVDTQKLVPLPA